MNILYTTEAVVEGGRAGHALTSDGRLVVELDRRGQAHGVRAFSVHPGGIYTDLARHLSAEELAFDGELKTPEQGAATSVWCATSPQLEGKGGVYCMDADIAEVIPDFTPQAGPTTDWSAPLGYRSRRGGATVAF
jgi:NAD(P)-dependent dehydrogenase (short-subunit alcohol dehydrogenase family)